MILLLPLLVKLFRNIHRHYDEVNDRLHCRMNRLTEVTGRLGHTAVVPVSGLHPGVMAAIDYALGLTQDVHCCYVEIDPHTTQELLEQWPKLVPNHKLVILQSPYRSVITPILDYLDKLGETTYNEMITVVVPEFVPAKWYHQFLHNQTSLLLRAALRFKRGRVITSVRYYID